MRENGIGVGDLVIHLSEKTPALLIKQTKKYYYFKYGDHIVRSSKVNTWRGIDTGKLEITRSERRRRKQKRNRALDLHGVPHGEVDERVRQFLNFVELPCSIITGNSQKMKDLVGQVVREYGWSQRDSCANYGEIIIEEKNND